ncbi:MAG: 2-phospho-L-lactate transferase CofD family protein, partial [Candidatus Omnitrophica bacterium]|nr:2-phospho-L-lactate transferase CofD family protein [Candidatus Omnitrophota bacterium]
MGLLLAINKFILKYFVVRKESTSALPSPQQSQQHMRTVTPADSRWLAVVSALGQLSYRQDLVEDILSQTQNYGPGTPEFEKEVKKYADFWGGIMAYQEGASFMKGKLGLRRGGIISINHARFVFTDAYLDALFRFCKEDGTNPIAKFDLKAYININAKTPLNEIQKDKIVDKFEEYLRKKYVAKGVPFIEFPVSIWKLYLNYIPKAIILILKNRGAAFKPEHRLKSRFWIESIVLWSILNLPIFGMLFFLVPAGIPWWGVIVCLIPLVLNIPLSIMSIYQANYGAMAGLIADKNHLAEVRHWSRAVYILKNLLLEQSTEDRDWLILVWNSIVNDLRNGAKGPFITKEVMDSLVIPEGLKETDLKEWLNNWNPKKPELRDAQIRIIKLMNKVLIDKPEIKNKNDVPPAIIQSSCFAEKFRVRFNPSSGLNELDAMQESIVDGDEVISQWNALMVKHGKEWELFIDKITGGRLPAGIRRTILSNKITAAKAYELLKGNCLSAEVPEGLELAIEDWANWRLENVWKTIESAKQAQLWSYKMKAARFLTREVDESLSAYEKRLEAWAKSRVYIIWLYDTYNEECQVDREFRSQANSIAVKEYLSRPINPGWVGVHYGSIDYRLWQNPDWLKDNEFPHYIIMHSFSARKANPSKAGAWSDVLPFLKVIAEHANADALLGIDAGHKIEFENWLYLPEFFREFDLDPTLGLIGIPYDIYGTEYSVVVKALGVGEQTFNYQGGRTQARVAMEHGYGKMGLRISALLKARAIITTSICEDTTIGIQLRQAGYHTKHIEYINIVQSAEKTFYDAANFVCRFPNAVSGDSLFLTPEVWEFFADANIHWTEKMGTLYNFMFYIRKPLVLATNVAMVILATVFPFNIFVWLVLPILFVYNGLVMSQSINFNTIQMFIEQPKPDRFLLIIPIPVGDGIISRVIRNVMYNIQGTVEFMKMFPILFVVFVPLIFNYARRVMQDGNTRLGIFTLCLRQSDLRRVSVAEIYDSFAFAIKIATAMLWLYIIFAPFHPIAWALNIFVFLTMVVTITAPFFLMPAKNRLSWVIKGTTGSIYGFIRATIEIPLDIVLIGWKKLSKLYKTKGDVFKGHEHEFKYGKLVRQLNNWLDTGDEAERKGWSGLRGVFYHLNKISLVNRIGVRVYYLNNFIKGLHSIYKEKQQLFKIDVHFVKEEELKSKIESCVAKEEKQTLGTELKRIQEEKILLQKEVYPIEGKRLLLQKAYEHLFSQMYFGNAFISDEAVIEKIKFVAYEMGVVEKSKFIASFLKAYEKLDEYYYFTVNKDLEEKFRFLGYKIGAVVKKSDFETSMNKVYEKIFEDMHAEYYFTVNKDLEEKFRFLGYKIGDVVKKSDFETSMKKAYEKLYGHYYFTVNKDLEGKFRFLGYKIGDVVKKSDLMNSLKDHGDAIFEALKQEGLLEIKKENEAWLGAELSVIKPWLEENYLSDSSTIITFLKEVYDQDKSVFKTKEFIQYRNEVKAIADQAIEEVLPELKKLRDLMRRENVAQVVDALAVPAAPAPVASAPAVKPVETLKVFDANTEKPAAPEQKPATEKTTDSKFRSIGAWRKDVEAMMERKIEGEDSTKKDGGVIDWIIGLRGSKGVIEKQTFKDSKIWSPLEEEIINRASKCGATCNCSMIPCEGEVYRNKRENNYFEGYEAVSAIANRIKELTRDENEIRAILNYLFASLPEHSIDTNRETKTDTGYYWITYQAWNEETWVDLREALDLLADSKVNKVIANVERKVNNEHQKDGGSVISKSVAGPQMALVSGSLKEVVDYLRITGMAAEANNLVLAIESVEKATGKKTEGLAVELVSNYNRYSDYENGVARIDILSLGSKSLAELELAGIVYMAEIDKEVARAPPAAANLTNLVVTFLKFRYFHAMLVTDQASILNILLSQEQAKPFIEAVMNTYPSLTKYSQIEDVIETDKNSGRNEFDIRDWQLAWLKELKETGYQERIAYTADNIVFAKEKDDNKGVLVDFYTLDRAAKYLGASFDYDALANYVMMRKLFAENDVKLVKRLVAEAVKTNRPLEEVLSGIVRVDYAVKAPYNKLPVNKSRAPPALYIYIGGAGKRATDFAQKLVGKHVAEPGYKDLDKLVLVSVCSISDEGGHIRKLEDGLLSSNEFWWYAIPTGDITVYPVKLALDKVKKEIMTERRIASYSCEIAVRGNIDQVINDSVNFPEDKMPADLMFFIANNLAMARLIDKKWVSKGLTKIDKASWQNLFYSMARIVVGQAVEGKVGADESKTMRQVYEMTGAKSGYAVPSTYITSPQAVILEGFAVGIEKKTGEDRLVHYVTIARDDEGKYWALESLTEGIIKPRMVIGNPEAREIKVTPAIFTRHGQDITVSLTEDKKIRVEVAGKEYVFNERGDYKTEVNFAGNSKLLWTDTFWTELLDLGEDLKFVAKSRVVEGQDKITDAAEYHAAVLQQAIFVDLFRDAIEKVQFANIDSSHSNRFKGLFGRTNDRAYTSRKTYPEAAREVIESIKDAFGEIIMGDSSIVTSVIAALMMNKLTEAIISRKDIPRVYIFKIMQDIESAGLSLMQQIELLDRSLQKTVNADFKFDQRFVDYLILPDLAALPEKVKADFKKQYELAKAKYEKMERDGEFAKGEKRSKHIPEEPLNIANKEEVEKYFAARGVRVVWTAKLDLNNAKYTYNQEALLDLIEEIKSRVHVSGIKCAVDADKAEEVLVEGNAEAAAKYIETINKKTAQNFEAAYETALKNAIARFPHLKNLQFAIRIAANIPYASSVKNRVIILNREILTSKPLVSLELDEAFYHLARKFDLSKDVTSAELALAELITDQEKTIRFHNMSASEQVEVINILLKDGIDLECFQDVLLHSYNDSEKFDLLINALKSTFKATDESVVALKALQSNQEDISMLLKKYFMKENVYSEQHRSCFDRLRLDAIYALHHPMVPGAIVLDVDGTILEKSLLNAAGKKVQETLGDEPGGEVVRNVFIDLLSRGFRIVIITGNEFYQANDRIASFIPVHLRKNLIIYANGAAQKFTFDESGKMYEIVEYSQGKAISKEDKAIIEKILRDCINEYVQDFYANRQMYLEKYDGFNFFDKTGKNLFMPDVQPRGERANGSVVQLALVGVPSRNKVKNGKITKGELDVREAIMEKVKQRLPPQLKAKYCIDRGGDTSIDIGIVGVNKSTALKDMVDTIGIDPEHIIAFGDEYRQGGNDITEISLGKQGVIFVSVNPGQLLVPMCCVVDDRGPQATRFWLRELVNRFDFLKIYGMEQIVFSVIRLGLIEQDKQVKYELKDFDEPYEGIHWDLYNQFKEETRTAADLFARVNQVKSGNIIVVGGHVCSGYNAFSEKLRRKLAESGRDAVIINTTAYYKDRSLRKVVDGEIQSRYRGAIETEWLKEDIKRLVNGEKVALPHYEAADGTSQRRGKETVQLKENDVLIVVGRFYEDIIEAAEGRDELHVYVNSPEEICLLRMVLRDGKVRGIDPGKTIQAWPQVIKQENELMEKLARGADFYVQVYNSDEINRIQATAYGVLDEVAKNSTSGFELNRIYTLRSILGNTEFYNKILSNLEKNHKQGFGLTLVGAKPMVNECSPDRSRFNAALSGLREGLVNSTRENIEFNPDLANSMAATVQALARTDNFFDDRKSMENALSRVKTANTLSSEDRIRAVEEAIRAMKPYRFYFSKVSVNRDNGTIFLETEFATPEDKSNYEDFKQRLWDNLLDKGKYETKKITVTVGRLTAPLNNEDIKRIESIEVKAFPQIQVSSLELLLYAHRNLSKIVHEQELAIGSKNRIELKTFWQSAESYIENNSRDGGIVINDFQLPLSRPTVVGKLGKGAAIHRALSTGKDSLFSRLNRLVGAL